MIQLETITAWAQAHIVPLLAAFAVCMLLLFVFCVVLLLKINREKKRYDFFMGTSRRPSYNLETQMKEYFEHVKGIDEKYSKILDTITDLDKSVKGNIRKVGLVRYNPFQEMGGNLCFALALLDSEDNGVVLNGIHSRTGSFTYAKPIEMGVSTYLLSEEEQEAIQRARDTAYEPQHEKIRKLKFKPLFKRRYAPNKSEANLPIRTEPIGDTTQAEREQIRRENIQADKIAAGVFPMDTFFERFEESEQQANDTAERIAAMHPRRAEEAAMDLRAAALQAQNETAQAPPDTETTNTETISEDVSETPVTESFMTEAISVDTIEPSLAENVPVDTTVPSLAEDVPVDTTAPSLAENVSVDTTVPMDVLKIAETHNIDTNPNSAYASLIFDALERATEKLMTNAHMTEIEETKQKH